MDSHLIVNPKILRAESVHVSCYANGLNMSFLTALAQRVMQIPPAESWDLHQKVGRKASQPLQVSAGFQHTLSFLTKRTEVITRFVIASEKTDE